MENILDGNRAELVGCIAGEKQLSHRTYGEAFYEIPIAVKRRSEYQDVIRLMISERLIWNENLKAGQTVHISGQVRTYNQELDGKNKLNVVVFVRSIEVLKEGESAPKERFPSQEKPAYEGKTASEEKPASEEYPALEKAPGAEEKNPQAEDVERKTEFHHENTIYLEGFICKPPVKRTSPLGREICDIMLAVNRLYNKSDYIPCIAWGRNAVYAGKLQVGDKISISGRIQSRQYKKREEDGSVAIKTAYEVSILNMEQL